MRMAKGLLLAIGIYINLLNSENVIEGRYTPSEYIALGMFVPNSKAHLRYYNIITNFTVHELHDISFSFFCTVPIECLAFDGDEVRVNEDCVSIEPQNDKGDYIDSHILKLMPNAVMRMLTKGQLGGGK